LGFHQRNVSRSGSLPIGFPDKVCRQVFQESVPLCRLHDHQGDSANASVGVRGLLRMVHTSAVLCHSAFLLRLVLFAVCETTLHLFVISSVVVGAHTHLIWLSGGIQLTKENLL